MTHLTSQYTVVSSHAWHDRETDVGPRTRLCCVRVDSDQRVTRVRLAGRLAVWGVAVAGGRGRVGTGVHAFTRLLDVDPRSRLI